MPTVRARLHAIDPYENFPLAGARLDLQGWHSTDPVFTKLIQEARPERIIEVGTWKGASAIGMATLAKRHGLQSEIICVDTWLGAIEFWTSHDDPTRYGSLKLKHGYPGVYYTFLANVILSGHADAITPFPQTSVNAARWFSLQGVQADLIYIDGSHEEADVLADLAGYWPLLREGGVIFGDDYSNASWPSVVRAVQTFARRHGLTVEEDNEFWIIRKTARPAGRPAAPTTSVAQSERPLLVVHADPEARPALAPFLRQLGYQPTEAFALTSAPATGAAVWVAPGEPLPVADPVRARFDGLQSLFWIGHAAGESADWCARWQAALAATGGPDHFVALHPYQPLAAQRERCERLCRRLGVDLVSLRLDDELVPRAGAPARPDPADGRFAAQLEVLNALGIGPHEYFDFPALQRIEARTGQARVEKPEGGNFEPYSPSHFLLHPPTPGQGWTRLHVRGLEWGKYRYLSTTLSLPSAQAPAVRFQWNIVSPQGQRLHSSETVLAAREVRNWVVPLPRDVPEGSFAVLATRVDSAATHAFAWSTWRDPILFS